VLVMSRSSDSWGVDICKAMYKIWGVGWDGTKGGGGKGMLGSGEWEKQCRSCCFCGPFVCLGIFLL
jgi:hypothetical protein